MSSIRYLTGDPAYYNLLARALSIVPSPDANPLFPVPYLCDGDPETPSISGSLADVNGWLIDVNQILNSNLDAWSGGSPVSWTKSASGALSSVTETTAPGEVRSGSAAKCHVGNNDAEARIVQERRVRSGELLMLDGWMRGDGVRSGQVALLNKDTNRYLRIGDGGDGKVSWGDYQSLFAEIGTSYANKRRSFQVESYAQTLRDTVTLQLILKYNSTEALGVGEAFFDDWVLIPAADWVSVHGHNAEPGLGFEIYAGDTAGTLAGVGRVAAPSPIPAFFNLLAAPLYKRMWRLRWESAPAFEERFAGEVVLGLSSESQAAAEFGYTVRQQHPQVRNVTRGGVVRSHKEGRFVERVLRLPFSVRTAEVEEIRQEWYERSWGGHHPMVIAPLDDGDVVIYGRLDDTLEMRRRFLDLWTPGDVIVAESPMPKVTK